MDEDNLAALIMEMTVAAEFTVAEQSIVRLL